MYQVKKRNGDICLFDLNKVKQAMKKTFESCNRNYQDSIIDMLSLKAIANAETKIKDSVLNVEDIQDSVESTLMAAGYEDVAKAYILYRKQHEQILKIIDAAIQKLGKDKALKTIEIFNAISELADNLNLG